MLYGNRTADLDVSGLDEQNHSQKAGQWQLVRGVRDDAAARVPIVGVGRPAPDRVTQEAPARESLMKLEQEFGKAALGYLKKSIILWRAIPPHESTRDDATFASSTFGAPMTTDALFTRIDAYLATDPEIVRFNPTAFPWDGGDRLAIVLRHPVTGERETLNAGWVVEIRGGDVEQLARIRRIVLGRIEGLGW